MFIILINIIHSICGERITHTDISCFPIALFKNEDSIPHLIYGEAWNHIQIMNLDSRQILTASKSLILENAVENHIKFYKNYKEDNKLPWPRPYDYFFGKLEMSPDKNNFFSAGWGWGSYDVYNIYEVKNFINNNQISDKNIDGWEHSNRAVCWINNETIAITYDPIEEGDENVTKGAPNEIHFYKVNQKKPEIERKIKVEGLNIVNSKIYYNNAFKSLILFSNKIGTAILSLEGKIIFHDKNMNHDTYSKDLNMFVKVDDKSITICQIKK